ncbi:unnamed protein product, partial [marine sediment metagenome]
EAWYKQGYPEGVSADRLLGYDWFERISLTTAHHPQFERVIAEDMLREGLEVIQDIIREKLISGRNHIAESAAMAP